MPRHKDGDLLRIVRAFKFTDMRQTISVVWSIALTASIPVSLYAAAETPHPAVEVRFCPASAVRTYPLESRRELQSLVLQNFAVVNHDTAVFNIEAIELELLRSGQVLDSKKLDGSVIQRLAERGAKMQAAGIIQQVAFQFCGTELITPSIKLAGPNLEKNQALLVSSQVFAFSGARDVRGGKIVAPSKSDWSSDLIAMLE